VVAPGRAKRPGAKSPPIGPPSEDELLSCPFCEGREGKTPPESLALGGSEGRQPDTPGWRVRVVPNLYPAFERQEVVIHGPEHARSLAELDDSLLGLVAEAWRQRAQTRRAEGLPFLHALVNEGHDAGASLAHSHSQLVWLPEEAPAAVAERGGGECRVCALVAGELAAEARVVAERDGLVLLSPWAGRVPYELLVAPVEHEDDGFESPLLGPALALVAGGLRRIRAVEGAHPLNLWLHTGSHWHIEVLPRLSILAGLELGAGVYLNALAPEDAAAALRKAAVGARPVRSL
jgi:UDPglucose--hexose-1-phosphate uridylyltransferase